MAVCWDVSMVVCAVGSMVFPTEFGKVLESVDSMEFLWADW